MKIVCDFQVEVGSEYCKLPEYAENENAWLWLALDCSDGEPQVQELALMFASTELVIEFRDVYEYGALLGHEIPRNRPGHDALVVGPDS